MATVVVLAGCSRGGRGAGAPAGGTVGRATTTTGLYDVPEVIDETYVNRVLAGLEAVEADAFRINMRTNSFPPESEDRMRAIYESDYWFEGAANAAIDQIREGFVPARADPGDVVLTVTRLVRTTPECILAVVTQDNSAVVVPGEERLVEYWVGLVPTDLAKDPFGYNPTGWAYQLKGGPTEEDEQLCSD